MKEIIATGKTIEEATSKAAQELGVSVDDVTVEILDMPKDGFFGIGAKPARLLVKYEDPKEAEEKLRKKEESKKTNEKSAKREAKPKVEKIVKEENITKVELTHDDIFIDEEEEGFVPNENAEPFLNEFLTGLFKGMNLEVSFTLTRKGKYIYIDLKGETSGVLIGKRGDTLDAIQHLTQLALNKAVHGGEKIRVDTEGYREKRTKTLVSLAKSIANRVIKSRGKYELEPMKAYERKIIHSTLQNYPMLTTYSVGNEPERRLVVAFKGK